MKRRFFSLALALCMVITALPVFAAGGDETAGGAVSAAVGEARQMEYLNRGGFAANLTYGGGVYLSWRLLGTEPMDTAFRIYKNGEVLAESCSLTNYTDPAGTADDEYAVAPIINGAEGEISSVFPMLTGNRDSSWKSSPYAYFDIPVQMPAPDTAGGFEANDASVGDVDGDGDYEIILKWEPDNAKDSASSGVTDHVYLDCYEMDGTMLWRIDLGRNIRAGQHYTQFQVFDYDGDGKAEMAVKTAPGTIDGRGHFVSEVGNTEEIRGTDNSASYVSSRGKIESGPEYLTIFNGESGAAMRTIDYYPAVGASGDWGDSNFNRSDRYLAATAYLDGVHPYMIFCRGYYNKSVAVAYKWDGENLTEVWRLDSGTSSSNPFYGQGNHNISVADLDNDGKDEIVYGSAAIDDNGSVLWSATNSSGRKLGHGDALHVSDFDNDGEQEVFKVLEDSPTWGRVFLNGKDGSVIWHETSTGDDGRGIMDYFSKQYGVLAWDASLNTRTLGGEIVNLGSFNARNQLVTVQDGQYPNFAIYWDGDLCREHFSEGRLSKWYDGEYQINDYDKKPAYDSNGNPLINKGGFSRLWTTWTSNPVSTNNSTKAVPCLQADLFGDWREELVLRHSDNSALRVFTSLSPSDYKFTTFMHDSQYRCAIAWQNTGYNQPPHQSYYIGYDKDTSEYVQPSIYVKELDPEVVFTVTDESGKPANGVSVKIADTSKVTDSNGVVAFRLPAGDYEYSVDEVGYQIASGSVTLKSGESAAQTIKLETVPDSVITVTSGGSPVSGASIEIDGRTVTTGSDGKVTVKLRAGDYDYTAACHKYVEKTGTLTVAASGSADLAIEMQAVEYVYDSAKDTNGGKFVYTGGEGAALTFSGGQWTFKQDSADGGRSFGGNFEMSSGGTMELEMTYSTGGTKDPDGNYTFRKYPFTHKIELLDNSGKVLFGISQEMAQNGAQQTKYYTGVQTATNVNSGSVVGAPSITANSAKTWKITIFIDFKNQTANLNFFDEAGENGYVIKDVPINVNSFERVEISSVADGNVTWTPKLKNVLYWSDCIDLSTPVPATATPSATDAPATATPNATEAPATATPDTTETPAADYDYTINSVQPAGDGVTVNITRNAESGGGILIIAVYNEQGALTAISTAEIKAALGETVDISVPIAYGGRVCAYVWSGFGDNKPIAAPYQMK